MRDGVHNGLIGMLPDFIQGDPAARAQTRGIKAGIVAAVRDPLIQRQMIRKCVEAKRPVIVATQMLHSMIKNPSPTRAEVTDIANAIYYRTDAIMLSGETTYGKYPVEAVQAMTKIAKEVDAANDSRNYIPVPFVKH